MIRARLAHRLSVTDEPDAPHYGEQTSSHMVSAGPDQSSATAHVGEGFLQGPVQRDDGVQTKHGGGAVV